MCMIIFGDKIFTNPIKIIKAFDSNGIIDAFEQIERLKNDFFIVGYLRYEAFNGDKSDLPLLYFEVFKEYEDYRSNFLSFTPKIVTKPLVDFIEYSDAICEIKNEIALGNTYEVNYTYDFEVECNCGDFELFEYLLQKQKTPYNFYLKNDFDTVLSFSPELFFTLKGNHIITKPMKGTIKRGQNPEEDAQMIEFLRNDEKNRAENVMIVDLLRNDLGRIAKTGTVKVSKLFEVETHKTLHQMTSQIEADLRENIKLYDIFKAIFPCGSITGAPKISTMRIIDKVEKGSRGIYCGAIGMISPDETVFSVPIRILQKHTYSPKGLLTNYCHSEDNFIKSFAIAQDDRYEESQNNKKLIVSSPEKKSREKVNFFKYRVGGAIVWDSDIQNEWEETLTKTKFLNENFQLIETIKVENGKLLYENEHFERIKKSAEHFKFKEAKQLRSEAAKLSINNGILRILLNKDGTVTTEYKPLVSAKTNKITISPIKINSQNEFMYHKTTYRPWFYDSYQKILAGEIYDEIFFNEKDELTEGARSNIILQIDGKLYTPPVSCGLLDGIYKKNMTNVTEKILYKSDLLNAEKIFCVNSVRGMVEVYL